MNLSFLLPPPGWHLSNIGESCEIYNHLREPVSQDVRKDRSGQFPYYGPTGILDYIDSYRVDGKYALIGEDGDHFLKFDVRSMTQLVEGKFNVNNHAHILKGGQHCLTDWFYYFFMYADITPYITRQGAGRYKLTKATLIELPILLPPLPEQRAIAAILSTWDEAITLTERLIEALRQRKQALMQLLLTGEVRFPGFEEEWEEKSFSNFLKANPRKILKPTGAYKRLGLRNRGQGTFITQVDDPDTVDMTHLFEVKAEDLIVSITFAWEGSIAIADTNDDGALVSHRFPTYSFDQQIMKPSFFQYVITMPNFAFELGLISPGGAGRNRVLSKQDFLKLTTLVPPLDEQVKIADALDSTDKELTLAIAYNQALSEEKRGLMQQLLTGAIRVRVQE